MKRWFTSDSHFGHKGILGHCNRPWDDTDVMDASLVRRWNEVVAPRDTVYHIGDFSFLRPHETADIINQLHGQIMLIEGNHDKKMNAAVKNMFTSVSKMHEITVDGQHIMMCHYAMVTWPKMHTGSWMLHGHSHGTLKSHCRQCGHDPGKKRLDVGVDIHDYYPVSFDEIAQIMETKVFTPVDHHTDKISRMTRERGREAGEKGLGPQESSVEYVDGYSEGRSVFLKK